MKAHKLKNNDKHLSKLDIETLLKDQEYEPLLNIDTEEHEYAYRFIDFNTPEELSKILRTKLPQGAQSDEYNKLPGGTLYPKEGGDNTGISSWTVNPRSLVYSGYFHVIPKSRKGLVLLRAKINNPKNFFFGNPDSMASNLDLDNGYGLEREVIGLGPIQYDRGHYRARERVSQGSLEGMAMDLIDKFLPVSKHVDWEDNYYFPKLSKLEELSTKLFNGDFALA